MSWRQFLKPNPEGLRVKRAESPPDTYHKTLKTLKPSAVETKNIPAPPLPKWQEDLCCLHGQYLGTTGNCQTDYCFCNAIIDCGGDLEKLRTYEIGHGVTCGNVLNCYLTQKDKANLRKHPAYFVLIAQSEKGRLNHGKDRTKDKMHSRTD